MANKKMRIGIIGTGGISKSHIRAYLRQPDVEIVAGCDLIPGKAEATFTELEVPGEAKFFTDYKEMLDTVELDAVSVCTYNCTHAECAIAALDKGLNVLLEKPFTVTLDEAIEVMKAEKRNGKFVSVGFQPRFDANMQMIKKIVQSGELGRIYYVQTGGGRRHGIPVGWSTTFIEEDKAGLGALGDIRISRELLVLGIALLRLRRPRLAELRHRRERSGGTPRLQPLHVLLERVVRFAYRLQ